jgi:23S rRNA (guanosine2251-2'-O)-methyltransferase
MTEGSGQYIEGRHPVLEALKSGRAITKILLARDAGRHSIIAEILNTARQSGIPVETVDGRALVRMGASGHSQGIIAVAAAKEYATLDGLLERSRLLNEPPLYMLLDGIEDPQNLGAIIRTANAAGVHGVVVPSRRAVGLTPAVSRASAGALEYVPVARVSNIHQAMRDLGEQGVWTVGLDAEASQDYTAADYRQPTALVVGGEGQGLSRLTRELCDVLVRIPMRGQIASLNASVAAALVMYEAMRQRSG